MPCGLFDRGKNWLKWITQKVGLVPFYPYWVTFNRNCFQSVLGTWHNLRVVWWVIHLTQLLGVMNIPVFCLFFFNPIWVIFLLFLQWGSWSPYRKPTQAWLYLNVLIVLHNCINISQDVKQWWLLTAGGTRIMQGIIWLNLEKLSGRHTSFHNHNHHTPRYEIWIIVIIPTAVCTSLKITVTTYFSYSKSTSLKIDIWMIRNWCWGTFKYE